MLHVRADQTQSASKTLIRKEKLKRVDMMADMEKMGYRSVVAIGAGGMVKECIFIILSALFKKI